MHCHLGFAGLPPPLLRRMGPLRVSARSPARWNRQHTSGCFLFWTLRRMSPRVGRAPLVDCRRARGRNRAGLILRACAHNPLHRGDRSTSAGPRDTEESRVRGRRALSARILDCMQRACSALDTHQSRKARQQPAGKAELLPQPRTRGEPRLSAAALPSATSPTPRRSSFHPRRQCRRRGHSTRLSRPAPCAASRDLPLASGTSDDLHRAVELGCFSQWTAHAVSRRGRECARQIPPGQLLLEIDMPARKDDNLLRRSLARRG